MIKNAKQSIDPQVDITELLDGKPYMTVPFPIGRLDLEKAMASFFRFLELPDEIKRHIDLHVWPQHRRGEVGFRHRSQTRVSIMTARTSFSLPPLSLKHIRIF
jgi:hypothetical protein